MEEAPVIIIYRDKAESPTMEMVETTIEYSVCASCGQMMLDGHDTADGPVCQDCISDYRKCEDCDEYVLREGTYITENGRTICQDCFDSHYCMCFHCEEIFRAADCRYIPHIGFVCEECLDENYFVCADCGAICSNEGGGFTENGDGPYCDSCLEENMRDNGLIAPHDYRPVLIFNRAKNEKKQKNKLFFGFELEIECPQESNCDSIAEEIKDVSDLFYCKHDSSLQHGFEIVSHPMSWRFIQSKRFQDVLTDLETCLKDNNCISHDSGRCGFHIHASKRCFSTLHIYKLLHFASNSANRRFFLDVSQRKEAQLDRWARLEDHGQSVISKAKDKRSDDRYTAFNLTRQTIECRIFRGNVRKDRIMKNIEFYHAIIEHTRQAPLKTAHEKTAFMGFLEENKLIYKNLHSFISEKNLF
jgi:hypothetical protein